MGKKAVNLNRTPRTGSGLPAHPIRKPQKSLESPATGAAARSSASRHADLTDALLRLSRRNAILRKEVAQLRVYRAMAYRDPLTGLWNRRFFQERLNEELSRSQRAGSSRKFSVMVVDLNDFKSTNDRYGHPMGDQVLKDAGAFLTAHLRHHDVACRTGGDEFSVLLPDLSADDCGQLMGRLRQALLVVNAKRRIPISFSIGTASWPDAGDTPANLEARADEAMYADKRRHKTLELSPANGRGEANRSKTTKRAARVPSRRGRPTVSAARTA